MVSTLLLSMWLSLPANIAVPPEDPLQINDQIKEFLAARIDPGDDPLTQLQTLVRVVFQENALNFTYEPVTRTAIETFTQHGGNCVSFTFLFMAMARQLGLDARFREVDIVPTWSKVGNLVSIHGHVNVAVAIGGQHYAVDLFPEVNRIEIGGRIVSDARALAHFLNNRGVDQLGAGNPEEALTFFRKALEGDPTTVRVWSNLGVALKLLHRYPEAEKAYLETLRLDPSDMVSMSNLASLYETMGRDGDCRRYRQKARKLQLKNPYYHFDLGMQSYRAGNYPECIQHLKTALKLKPVEHNFHMAMARTYSHIGRMDRVSSCLKQALEDAPDNPSRLRYNEKLALLASYRPSRH